MTQSHRAWPPGNKVQGMLSPGHLQELTEDPRYPLGVRRGKACDKGSQGQGSHQNTWSLVTHSCRSVHFFPRSDDTYNCKTDKRETELWQGV